MSTPNAAVVRFEDVSFSYGHNHPILKEAVFSLKRGMKVTLMGQNGAGKSTLFKLIMGMREPLEGLVIKAPGLTIAMAAQVMTAEDKKKTVRQYFEDLFSTKVYDIDPKIDEVLEVVNLAAYHDALISSF